MLVGLDATGLKAMLPLSDAFGQALNEIEAVHGAVADYSV